MLQIDLVEKILFEKVRRVIHFHIKGREGDVALRSLHTPDAHLEEDKLVVLGPREGRGEGHDFCAEKSRIVLGLADFCASHSPRTTKR